MRRRDKDETTGRRKSKTTVEEVETNLKGPRQEAAEHGIRSLWSAKVCVESLVGLLRELERRRRIVGK